MTTARRVLAAVEDGAWLVSAMPAAARVFVRRDLDPELVAAFASHQRRRWPQLNRAERRGRRKRAALYAGWWADEWLDEAEA